MATATALPLAQEPEILAAAQGLGEAESSRDALIDESNRIFRLRSPYALHDGPTGASAADVLRAEDREPEVARALRAAKITIDERAAAKQQTVERVRARRTAERLPRKRDAVAQIVRDGHALALSLKKLRDILDEDEADGLPVDRSLTMSDIFGDGSADYTPRWSYLLDTFRQIGLL